VVCLVGQNPSAVVDQYRPGSSLAVLAIRPSISAWRNAFASGTAWRSELTQTLSTRSNPSIVLGRETDTITARLALFSRWSLRILGNHSGLKAFVFLTSQMIDPQQVPLARSGTQSVQYSCGAGTLAGVGHRSWADHGLPCRKQSRDHDTSLVSIS